ncbi:hypothetical protein [Flavobacterium sp. GCM10027622]|uniref:hypothetical protein n=1 Tax=unclassified Flavobacterium TaxID=196869 RepID=UPI00360E9166
MKNKLFQIIQNLSLFVVNHSLSFLLLGILTSVNAQSLKKDSIAVQKIIQKYNKEKKVPTLLTITDTKEVQLISQYIEKCVVEKKKKEAKLKLEHESKLGRRYRNGDNSVVPDIIKILREKNLEKINTLLSEMDLVFDEKPKKLILDPAIKQLLFQYIEDENLEHIVVQFLGINKIEGSIPLFENRLLSGQSKDNGRIFFWLAQEGTTEKAVNYIHELYFKQGKNLLHETWIFEGISEILKKGSEQEKKKILDIVFDYLEKNPVTNADFKHDTHLSFFSESQLKLALLSIVLDNGDQRTFGLLKKIEDTLIKELKGMEDIDDFKNKIKLTSIRFLNNSEKVGATLESLTKKDIYFEMLEVIQKDPFLQENKNIEQHVLQQFDRFGFTDAYDHDRLLTYFKNKKKEEFTLLVRENIRSKELQHQLLEAFTINKYTFDEINQYLYSSGLIEQPISKEQVTNYLTENEYPNDLNSIYTCMEIAKISVAFDTETGFTPVDYDVLLDNFAQASKHKISGIQSVVIAKLNPQKEQLDYQFLVHYKNKCYVMFPEDFGDWYDMESFPKLLDLIVKDSGITEEFVYVSTGGQDAMYIFGETKKIEQLKKKFKLDYE